MFTGLYTALITPFKNGKIDYDAFQKIVEDQVAQGVDGIVPAGTTGESPTLTTAEHLELIEKAVQFANGRIKVVAGTGANSTAEAIHLTKEAERLGVDGSLQVTPYYNKPSQEGLFLHFSEVAKNTELPLMLYSVPGRSVIELSVELVSRLTAAYPQINSIKEAGGSVGRVNDLKAALPDHVKILCGDDPLTLSFMTAGAEGLVSVASNLIPAQMKQLVDLCLKKDLEAAQKSHQQLYGLTNSLMNLDVNPVPIKSAMAKVGFCSDEFRLPLTNLSQENEETLISLLQNYAQ